LTNQNPAGQSGIKQPTASKVVRQTKESRTAKQSVPVPEPKPQHNFVNKSMAEPKVT
jgi:hypothetical protein